MESESESAHQIVNKNCTLKVQQCRLEDLPIYLCLYKNNTQGHGQNLKGAGFQTRKKSTIYTESADLKISLYIQIFVKIIPWEFSIFNCNHSRDIHP